MKYVRKFSRKIIFFLLLCSLSYTIYLLIPRRISLIHTQLHLEDGTCIENGSWLNAFESQICIRKPQVFFVETSSARTLNTRQACAVESAALNNPSLEVKVLMTPADSIDFQNSLMKSLASIQNLQIVQIEIAKLVNNTPIWDWYMAGLWKKSEWKASHLSDSLRFFLMWKYGGIYLDTDIVVLRSMEYLKNSVVTENWDRVASGIMIFDKGHDLMKQCMLDFAANYDAYNFVNNGPGVITRNIRRHCGIYDIGKVSGSNCMVDVLPPEAAFPIPYDKWEEYFVPSPIKSVSHKFNSSYLIHVWNKYSKVSKLRIGKNSLYEGAMREHCPSVYKHAQFLVYV